ncbi:/ / Type II restriction enzyme HinfI-like protein / 524633:525424 Reverse [Candidatus Hepatoplasma crinochetorum]|uniref:type II site-specific deoxyribonuclease n=1 Tax=Candidatus Hepatoplasma crinochetorum TaxID=295596 RepID=A0A0G7ZN51_9MOLU|nr:/ / Type II restriction enzyme HinfI-like protein / 524633:525424 Reverse [Candidatus Hepatoplasma crinochetorum]
MNINQEKLEKIISNNMNDLIESKMELKTFNKKNVNNKNKIHFLPIEFRNLISFMQSINISFGNFIEKLIRDIIKEDKKYNLSDLSGKKIPGIISNEENNAIENYMREKKLNLDFLINVEYKDFLLNTKFRKKDIDLLLYDNDNNYYLFEIKYLDNHDTGKHENIYKKLFETTFALRRYFEQNKINYKKIEPILYFFNEEKRWKVDYLEENKNLLRGKEFWTKFSNISFEDLKKVFSNISNNEIIKNNLKSKVNNILFNHIL